MNQVMQLKQKVWQHLIQGEYKEAYESQLIYYKYNDSIVNENNLKDALYKDFEYQSEKMNFRRRKKIF